MGSSGSRTYRPVKTPTVLQMEAAECGAAALGIILEYHGRLFRSTCSATIAASRVTAAMPFISRRPPRRYGLEVKAFRKPAEGYLEPTGLPSLFSGSGTTFWSSRDSRRGKVYINDPASGRRTIGEDEFQRAYSGIAFTFERVRNSSRQGHEAQRAPRSVPAAVDLEGGAGFVILAGLALVIPNFRWPRFSGSSSMRF